LPAKWLSLRDRDRVVDEKSVKAILVFLSGWNARALKAGIKAAAPCDRGGRDSPFLLHRFGLASAAQMRLDSSVSGKL